MEQQQQQPQASRLKEAGTFTAQIIDYGIWKGAKGPMAAVMMQYKDSADKTNQLTWFGSFNGGAREYTIETLIRCGFKGSNGAELNKGKGSGVLDEVKNFEIVVRNEPNPMKGNQLQSRIAFINLPGGDAFRAKLADQGEAAVLMGGLNLAGDFAAARAKGNQPKAPTVSSTMNAQNQAQQSFTSEEDIPF